MMQKLLSCKWVCCGSGIVHKLVTWLHCGQHAMLLILRLWIAHIFWKSGVQAASNWETTIYLFTYEHPVPLLPPSLAAVMGTGLELLCPVLLTIGFATRFSALALLGMTALIELTYVHAADHIYWALLLGVIIFCGPGTWSLDHRIAKKCANGNACQNIPTTSLNV